MKNLLNFFFSFDKLFKEKLIVPFFWLALIVWGLEYFSTALASVTLEFLPKVINFVQYWVSIIFALVVVRLVSELAVAIFRINDNLSPDGGKSELADIDPIAEARKAAELAAARTREATKTVSEKAGEATKSLRDNAAEMGETVSSKAKAASASVRDKAGDLKSKASTPKPEPKTKPKPKAKTTATKTKTASKPATTTAPKKRGRPAGSKNKTTAAKTTAKKTTSKGTGKRGPKPGTKIPRDKDGNLLKKDGTPRKKPGPKK